MLLPSNVSAFGGMLTGCRFAERTEDPCPGSKCTAVGIVGLPAHHHRHEGHNPHQHGDGRQGQHAGDNRGGLADGTGWTEVIGAVMWRVGWDAQSVRMAPRVPGPQPNPNRRHSVVRQL